LWKQQAADGEFDKFWFSLNTGLSCLFFWNDKYEQDLGKFPLGKFELTKCCQVVDENSGNNLTVATSSGSSGLVFKISFHQGANGVVLKATSADKKAMWCEALRHTCEQVAAVCAKCKPKLIVNPMVSSSSANTEASSGGPGVTQVLTSPYQSVAYAQAEQKKARRVSNLRTKTS